jgi:hypothetical protein
MRDDVFADGIGEITVTGTTVRIDLVSLSATERDADNKPKSVFRQRIVMPVESFMGAFDLMERVAKQLIEAGTVKRRAPTGAAPADRPRSSPNFP